MKWFWNKRNTVGCTCKYILRIQIIMSQGIGFAARLKIVLPIASHSVSPEHCGWWRFIPTDTRWWEIYSMNGLSLSSAGLRWLDLTSHLFPPSSQTHHQQLRGVVFRNSERAPLVNNLTEHRYTYLSAVLRTLSLSFGDFSVDLWPSPRVLRIPRLVATCHRRI